MSVMENSTSMLVLFLCHQTTPPPLRIRALEKL